MKKQPRFKNMSISMIKKPYDKKDKYFGAKMSRSIDVDLINPN
jgi:hypothetical protein